MQFEVNSDFPAYNLPKEQWHAVARPPVPFEEAKFIPCVCITTRVLVNVNMVAGLGNDYLTDEGLQQNLVALNGTNYLVQTARGVIVKTPTPMQQGGGGIWSDSSDSSVDTSQSAQNETHQLPQHPSAPQADRMQPLVERAYWLRRTIRAAIYGKVRFGIVLQKLNPPVQLLLPGASPTGFVNIEWEATAETVAVKEMSWGQIQTEGHRLAEDPVKEVVSTRPFSFIIIPRTLSRSSTFALQAAMQHLERWLNDNINSDNHQQHADMLRQQQYLLQQQSLMNISAQLNGMNITTNMNMNSPILNQQQVFGTPPPRPKPRNMLEAHVMTTLDSLTDGRNLYLVMPYCAGGELFDVLEKKNKFSEREARFWFRQILEVSCFK